MKYLFSLICLSFALHGYAQEKKVGLVLSGGGAKGYAHIGALKALEEANIPIDYIGGTSMGAIIGGLYAAGYTAQELEAIVYKLDFEKLLLYDRKREEVPYFDKVNKDKYLLELPFDDFKLQIPSAVSKGQGPANVFSYLFRHVGGNIDFNDLPIPFLCIGTNLETGEMTVFRKGNLAKSVLASGAYPTLIKPVEIDGKVFTDGGVTNNFPVKQVKSMGADILIGIDLNDELFKQQNLDTAAKVLEQIIRYRIVNNTEEQKKEVDHYIAPSVSHYSVIDFEKGKEIIQLGYQITKNHIEAIKQSVKREPIGANKKGPPIDESILVSELKINGLNDFNASYIKGKMDINPPHYTNYNELSKGIDNLYATGNFQNIFYELIPTDIGKTLVLNFIEKPNKQTIKFGLHYDDLYKTGVLVNLSARKLIFTNSRFSADIILGDNPRYNLNYFVNNGVYPSFGIASTYKNFKNPIPVQGLTIDNLEYDWNEFNNRFYTQSTLADRYAIGFGLEHQYISVFSPNVSRNNSLRYIENGYFINPYAFVGIDNRDDTDFPTKGILFNGIVKHLWFSNSTDFEANSLLDARIQMNFPLLSKKLVLQAESEFGTFTDVDASRAQFFTLGGFNQQPFLNSNTFYGLPFGHIAAPNKWLIRMALQFNFFDHHYLKTIANVANYEAGIDRINFFEYDYTGIALQYAYDSPLGPLQLFWSYSPQTQQGLINFSLGFWF